VPSAAPVSLAWAHVDDLGERHLDLLDEPERARWSRLERADDRARFALGAVLIRGLVADLDDTVPERVALDRACPRCGEQHGPVTSPGRAWRCSVAHSGSLALAAVVAASAATTVGVDLETRCPPDWRDLLPRVLAPDEGPPSDDRQFLAVWVRKEAVVKATGEGLSRPMSSVRLSTTGGGVWAEDASGLTVVDLALPLPPASHDAPPAAALAVAADRVRVGWRSVTL
jgi:4'-phosphopantetheinyl transferase